MGHTICHNYSHLLLQCKSTTWVWLCSKKAFFFFFLRTGGSPVGCSLSISILHPSAPIKPVQTRTAQPTHRIVKKNECLVSHYVCGYFVTQKVKTGKACIKHTWHRPYFKALKSTCGSRTYGQDILRITT